MSALPIRLPALLIGNFLRVTTLMIAKTKISPRYRFHIHNRVQSASKTSLSGFFSTQPLLCGGGLRPDDQVTPHFISLPSFRPPQVCVLTVLLANKFSLYHTRSAGKVSLKKKFRGITISNSDSVLWSLAYLQTLHKYHTSLGTSPFRPFSIFRSAAGSHLPSYISAPSCFRGLVNLLQKSAVCTPELSYSTKV
jgi:hypothetical protein